MDNITAKSQYDGTTTPVPATSVHTADELNDRIVEQEGSVTDSGQSLDVLDAGQQSKAMFANGVAAQSMLDSGGVNSVVLTPITGASGLRVATPLIKDYSLLNGAIFSFKANNTNTGNMTVNVGQTGGTLIGAQPLFLEDGTTDIPVGHIVSGQYYNVRYDSSLDVDGAFELLSSSLVQTVSTIASAVATGSTAVPYDDTIPQNTEGDEYMTLAITPQNIGNKLKIEVVFNFSENGSSVTSAALFQDSIANALGVVATQTDLNSANGANQITFTYTMAAGTTSSTTFKVRAGTQGGNTITFNGVSGARKFGGVMSSSITITETKA